MILAVFAILVGTAISATSGFSATSSALGQMTMDNATMGNMTGGNMTEGAENLTDATGSISRKGK